jgi:hypothetical protein
MLAKSVPPMLAKSVPTISPYASTEVRWLSVDLLQRRRRHRAGQPQRAAPNPVLPRTRRRDAHRTARMVRDRRLNNQRHEAWAQFRRAANASTRPTHEHECSPRNPCDLDQIEATNTNTQESNMQAYRYALRLRSRARRVRERLCRFAKTARYEGNRTASTNKKSRPNLCSGCHDLRVKAR